MKCKNCDVDMKKAEQIELKPFDVAVPSIVVNGQRIAVEAWFCENCGKIELKSSDNKKES